VKIDFRNVLGGISGAIILMLVTVKPFLARPFKDEVDTAALTLLLGTVAIVVVYNKLKYGVFFPGWITRGGRAEKAADATQGAPAQIRLIWRPVDYVSLLYLL
jgi:hypothetical protein